MLLKNIVSIKGGKRLPKGHMLVSYQNDHPYIRVRDLGKPILEINDSYEYVSANDYPLIKNYTTNHGDILISIVGTIGLVGIVGKTLHNANLTENCVKLSNPKNYLNRYLYYYLISTKGQEQIAQGTVGSTQPKLPIYNIEKINIPEISFNEQQHIVNILGSIDDKIENNEKIIKKINNYLNLIYQKYFKNIVPNETLGSIIENHDRLRKPLSSCERSELKKIYPYYGATEIVDYVDNYIFDGDYLLLGEDGTVIDKDGYPIVQRVQGKFWANNHTHILTAKRPIDNNLLELILKNTNVKSAVTGAVQLKINQANLYNLKISLPDNDIIASIKSLVLPLFNKRFFIEDENKKLNNLKQLYLKKFFN